MQPLQIEDFRFTAHNGAEIGVPFTIETIQYAQQSVITQRLSADVILLSEEGLKQFGILGQFGEMHTEVKPIFRSFFDLNRKKKSFDVGFVGWFLGMEVYTDYFLEPSMRFITAAGRILPFPNTASKEE